MAAREETSTEADEKADRKALYPDGGWGWVVSFGSAVAHFLVVGLGRSFGLFYLVLLDKFEQSAAATSLVVALYNTMRQMLGPIAGFLVDRFTCRWVVISGGIVMLVGCVISAFATSLLYLFITFGVITGIGGSLIFAPSYIIVGQYFDKKKGKAMGLATIGSGLGTVALAPIISLLLRQYSFFGAMLIMGAIQLNNCVCGSLFRPLPQWSFKKKKKETRAKELKEITDTSKGDSLLQNDESPKETEDAGKSKKCCKFGQSFAILKNRTFLLYGCQIIAMSICVQTFLTFLPGIAIEHGVDNSSASLLLSVVGFADMIGRFLWGVFFDFKPVRYRRRLFHAILGLPVGGFALFTGFMYNYWGFVIMSVLFGLVEGGFHGQRATIVSEFVAKEQMSSTVGFVICFQGVGNMLGPPIGGALRDINGNYSPSYFFCGATIIFTSILFLTDYIWKSFRHKSSKKISNPEV